MLPTITYRTPNRSRRALSADSEFERLLDGFFVRPMTWPFEDSTGGTADLYETEDEYVLEFEMAGVRHEDLDVTVERGVLTVTARTGVESENEGRNYLVRERARETFSRSFRLSESIASEEVSAELTDGVLTVRVPKAPEAKPRRVEVSVK